MMVKNFCLLLTIFPLTACDSGSWQSVDDFIENNKFIQEQNSYSNKNLSTNFTWSEEVFPKRCEWYVLKRVVDGDTVVALDETREFRIRLTGIDTPESKHPKKPVEPGSLEATAYLESLLTPKDEFCLIDDRVGDKVDRYGRTLGYLFTTQGLDINLDLLQQGHAKPYLSFPFERKEEFSSF